MEIYTKSAKNTKGFGKKFGSSLKGGEVIALVGNLGSGKTTFVQGLAEELGVKGMVISPTFILQRQYEITNYKLEIRNLYHIDLYRLERNIERELQNLGIADYWGKSENLVVIEWADKIQDLLPEDTIWITFEGSGEEMRKIQVGRGN